MFLRVGFRRCDCNRQDGCPVLQQQEGAVGVDVIAEGVNDPSRDAQEGEVVPVGIDVREGDADWGGRGDVAEKGDFRIAADRLVIGRADGCSPGDRDSVAAMGKRWDGSADISASGCVADDKGIRAGRCHKPCQAEGRVGCDIAREECV